MGYLEHSDPCVEIDATAHPGDLGVTQTGSRVSITAASCLADRHSCIVITSW
jgi:hypothetical protein